MPTLDGVLAKGDLAECVEFFRSLPEKERKQLAAPVAEVYEKIAPKSPLPLNRAGRGRARTQMDLASIMQHAEAMRLAVEDLRTGRAAQRRVEEQSPQMQTLRLAILATSNFNQVKATVWPLPDPTMVIAVLKDRRPDWLDKWAAHLLKRDARSSWILVRALEREALIDPPESSDYYLGMIQLVQPKKVRGEPLADDDLLLTDKGLFESRVWEMLHSEQSMARAWSAGNWCNALMYHSKTGTISRKKLLDETLDGMLRHSVSQNQANMTALNWFTDMYNKMEPGADDVRDCGNNYLRLLASPAPSVLKLALAALNKYPEQVPTEELCAQIVNAFRAKGKEHLLNALKLLKVIAQRDERAKELVIDCLSDAIKNDNTEFRNEAFSLFENLAASLNIDAIDRLRTMRAELGSLRPRVEKWLEGHAPDANSNVRSIRSAAGAKSKLSSKTESAASSTSSAQAQSRVAQLQPEVAELAGIPQLLSAIENGNLPYVPALDLTDQRVPRLIVENAMEPVNNLDDLIFLLHRIMEGKCKADDVEQAFDALARLCDQRPEDFDRRVAPLKKQAQKQLTPPEHSQMGMRVPMAFTGKHYLDDIAGVILAWVDKKPFTIQSAVDRLKETLAASAASRVRNNNEFQKVVEMMNTMNSPNQKADGTSQTTDKDSLAVPATANNAAKSSLAIPPEVMERLGRLLNSAAPGATRDDRTVAGLDGLPSALTPLSADQSSEQPSPEGISETKVSAEKMLEQLQDLATKAEKPDGNPEELRMTAIEHLTNNPYLRTAYANAQGRIHPLHFFSGRAANLTRRLAAGKAAPLLSAPTHKGGWIDPRIVATRIRLAKEAGVQVDWFDAIQMLLRLAPEHRSEALTDCKDISGEFGDVLRYALGGEPPSEMKTDTAWIASARVRSPYKDDPVVVSKFPGLGPDAAEAAEYELHLSELKDNTSLTAAMFERVTSKFLSAKQSQKSGLLLAMFPTVLLHTKAAPNIATGDFMSKPVCEMLIWPQNRESYFAGEARQLSKFIESEGSYWKGEWEPLFDPDVDARGNARWLIALALTAKQQEVRRLGIDALIACIDEGRLDGPTFGEVLSQAINSKAITLTRWLSSFDEVSKVSPLHLQVVRLAIERSFAGVRKSDFKTSPKLIEFLYELCCGSGESITDDCARNCLEAASKGTGKAAKVAKDLLALDGKDSHEHRKAVAAYALERRLERAERWQNSFKARTSKLSSAME